MTLQLEIPLKMGFTTKTFILGYKQQTTVQTGGFLQTLDRTTPMWFAEYRTPPLRPDRYNDAIGFLLQLDGAMETFLAYDPRRPMPYSHRTAAIGTNPWKWASAGNPQVTAYDYTTSTITLGKMLAGSVVTPGDYISFKIGNIWYLYRVSVGGVVPAGNALAVQVKPRPQIVGFVPTDIRYQKAVCEMKMIGGIQEEDSVESLPVLSFKAFQFMNRTT